MFICLKNLNNIILNRSRENHSSPKTDGWMVRQADIDRHTDIFRQQDIKHSPTKSRRKILHHPQKKLGDITLPIM